MDVRKWYLDWQSAEHVELFDGRASLSSANLLRCYEAFNDVRILNERLDLNRELSLLEVGCATGEFYRYLRIRYPQVRYFGADISKPAIERAKEKYPQGPFFLVDPEAEVTTLAEKIGLRRAPAIVYAKDVVQHQTDPFGFVSELVRAASEMAVFRCRTRDRGKTVLDPEQSCQYHYGGWMPYIVLNLDELIEHIKGEWPRSEILVYRNHMVLGGQHNRYLPKDCYLREAGTAETAVGVFLRTDRPGYVSVTDRLDQNPRYTLDHLVRAGVRKALSLIR